MIWLEKRTLGNDVNYTVKGCCYTGLVRPLLEYSMSLWSPYNKNLINMLEAVWRHARKYILIDYTSDYKDILSHSNLLPLTYRREYSDIVFTFNSIQGLNDFDMSKVAVNYENVINLSSGYSLDL